MHVPSLPAIRLENLKKRYDAYSPDVLKGLNLEIPQGQFVAIMGPSGCGKSTLLNLIGAMDTASQGEIFLEDTALSTLDADGRARLRREHIGYVFQFFNLLPTLTVRDNVQLPLDLQSMLDWKARREAEKSLTQVGLEDKMLAFPTQLSGGQMQRVAIARATVHNPRLILADEPTGNLDSQSGQQVLDILLMRSRDLGATVVMVTHSEEAAMLADRLIQLKDGRILRDTLLRDREASVAL
jgi:putative ABC transport system ATP-binding protein